MFCLGWQPRRWTAALDIENNQGQFQHDGKIDRFTFQADPGAAGSRCRQGTAIGSADRRAHRSNLILGLNATNIEVFPL